MALRARADQAAMKQKKARSGKRAFSRKAAIAAAYLRRPSASVSQAKKSKADQ
jgi:hypothetical protein